MTEQSIYASIENATLAEPPVQSERTEKSTERYMLQPFDIIEHELTLYQLPSPPSSTHKQIYKNIASNGQTKTHHSANGEQ
jgi:hypothetical protein